METKHIHVSDMRSFKSCRVKWSFTSPMKGGWAPKTTPKALKVGTLVHQSLDLWYQNRSVKLSTCWEKIWNAELVRIACEEIDISVEDQVELRDKVAGILSTYANWANQNDHYEVVHIEQAFEVPLMESKGVYLAGKMDQIVRDPQTGMLWVRDFKVTTADFLEYTRYLQDQDDQARAYYYAVKLLFPDENIGGVIFTLLRSKKPTVPELLKSGKGLSKAAIDTTEAVFLRQIQKYGLVREEYDEILQSLRTKALTRPWVSERRLVFSHSEIAEWLRRTKSVVLTMLSESPMLWTADFFTCKGCAFRNPCASRLRGDETHAQSLLETHYTAGRWAMEALELQEEVESTE